MSVSLKVTGNGSIGRAAGKLESAARGGLKRDLESAVRRATKPVPAGYQKALRAKMPSSGGLAADLAARVAVNRKAIPYGQRLTARSSQFDMPSLERGRLRHPLFGNRRYWYDQKVPAGLFAAEVRAVDDAIRREVLAAIRRATGGTG